MSDLDPGPGPVPASPVRNRVGSVFVHVTDMAAAIAWYGRLLGVPPGSTGHEGLIHDLPMDGGTRLTLDGHAHARGEFRPSPHPLLTLWADDIAAAHEFVTRHAPAAGPVEDIGSVSVFHFRDPDGNRLVAMSRNTG